MDTICIWQIAPTSVRPATLSAPLARFFSAALHARWAEVCVRVRVRVRACVRVRDVRPA